VRKGPTWPRQTSPRTRSSSSSAIEASSLLEHTCETISSDQLHLPGPDFIDRLWLATRPLLGDAAQPPVAVRTTGAWRGRATCRSCRRPGHRALRGASFAPNPIYFDPENLVALAIEGGCNAVASTFGVLGMVARKWATKIPFIVKLNHNELLSYPNTYDQTMFGNVHRAWEMGATASARRSTSAREESRAS
jgi:class I fructose-bisphosphate aldolase